MLIISNNITHIWLYKDRNRPNRWL